MSLINLSVDCVILGFDDDQKLKILLIKKIINKKGDVQYAIPGDLLEKDEDLLCGAKRILKNLTSLDNLFLKQFRVFGDPKRGLKELFERPNGYFGPRRPGGPLHGLSGSLNRCPSSGAPRAHARGPRGSVPHPPDPQEQSRGARLLGHGRSGCLRRSLDLRLPGRPCRGPPAGAPQSSRWATRKGL